MSKGQSRIRRFDCPVQETDPVTSLRDDASVSGGSDPIEEANETSDPFPTDDIPPVVARFVREITRVQHVPEAMVGSCALGILAAAIGAGLELQRGAGKTTRGNLYIVTLARSGVGKSETLKLLTAPMDELENERISQWQRETAPYLRAEKKVLLQEIQRAERAIQKPKEGETRESILALLSEKEADLQRVNDQLEPPRFCVDDITTEKLAVLLAKNGEVLTSCSADGRKTFDNICGRNQKANNTDEDIYLKGFSSDTCRVDRVSRDSVHLLRPCLSMVLMVQPDKYDQLSSNRSVRESGFLARLLVSHIAGEPRFLSAYDEDEISSEAFVEYHHLIRTLLVTFRLAGQAVIIETSAEARDAFRAHYNSVMARIENGEVRDIDSFAVRWTEQAWRIAVGLHAGTFGVSAGEHRLSLRTAQSAIRLSDWFQRQQLALLDGTRASAKMELKQRIIAALVDQPGGMKARDIYRRLRLDADSTAALLDGMVANGELTSEEVRPREGGTSYRLYKLKPR